MAIDPNTRTGQLFHATRKAHNDSNRQVRYQLGLVLMSRPLWANALGLFYPIFQKLHEIAKGWETRQVVLDDTKKNDRFTPELKKLCSIIHRLDRPAQFRQDIEYFCGDEYPELQQALLNDSPPPLVQEYCAYLDELNATDPIRLIPFFYSLHMGLFAGGAVIKRMVIRAFGLAKNKNDSNDKDAAILGVQAFDFGKDAAELKQALKDAVDSMELSPEEDARMLMEAPGLFARNNQIIVSIETTQSYETAKRAFVKKVQYYGGVALALVAAVGAASLWMVSSPSSRSLSPSISKQSS